MIAFAGNSVLCRLALVSTKIDAASFTSIRLLSGAVVLMLLVTLKSRVFRMGGSWWSAVALFGYAAAFSFAYISLSAATGALLLFGAVQATMIGYGLVVGERLNLKQVLGIIIAIIGLLVLLFPGFEAPPIVPAFLMLGAGIAWGVYSLRGRGLGDATEATAGNFVRAAPLALVVSLLMVQQVNFDPTGVLYGVLSGALASGVGYAIWYSVLPSLKATTAATVQLSVPAIASIGGVAFLAEPITIRLAVASAAILGGVGVYILSKRVEVAGS